MREESIHCTCAVNIHVHTCIYKLIFETVSIIFIDIRE